MFETIYNISLGSRAGIMNRAFTVITILMVLVQLWRMLRFRLRLVRWRYRLRLLEQEARQEGVVTVTDPEALPPLDPYLRLWDIVPSMAIMFGLLGTFIGLTVSLSEIPVTGDVAAIQKGLSRSIPSMGTAFWTSLCGLVVALTVRIVNALMSSSFRQRVIDQLMLSEPQVLEALESAAFQQGRDGALLRPHSIQELLWHQNRRLNQTMARVAPQISEGIARGMKQISEAMPMETSFLQSMQQMSQAIERGQREQLQQMERLLESQQQLLQLLANQQGVPSTPPSHGHNPSYQGQGGGHYDNEMEKTAIRSTPPVGSSMGQTLVHPAAPPIHEKK